MESILGRFIGKSSQVKKTPDIQVSSRTSGRTASELEKLSSLLEQYNTSLSKLSREIGGKDCIDNEKLAEMAADISTLKELALKEEAEASDELLLAMEAQKKEMRELIHSENVKVYRNVQAVIVDENAKINESINASKRFLSKKISTTAAFAILSFFVALLILAFDILKYLGII